MSGRRVLLIGEVYDLSVGIGGGPIYPPPGGGGGGQPPWGGVAPPYPDQGLPGQPPGIWGPNDPRPTPPIYIGEIPPGIVDGQPEHPIYIPIFPAHPIVIPPDAIAPGVPAHPIYLPPGIWGPTDPRPTHPIYIPLPPGGIDEGPPPKPTHPIYIPVYPAHPIRWNSCRISRRKGPGCCRRPTRASCGWSLRSQVLGTRSCR